MIGAMIKGLWITLNRAINHDAVEHAGYLSYLLMLTFFPFLVFFVALVGFVGKADLADALVNLILNSPWASFIDALRPRILEITESPPQGLLTFAIVSAIWTASSIFEAVRTILNKVNHVTNAPPYIWRRLLSMLEFSVMVIITIGFMFILVILPSTWEHIHTVSKDIPSFAVLLGPSMELWRGAIILAFAYVVVSSMYHFLPNRRHKFSHTTIGSIFVMKAWIIATLGFRYYLQSVPSINIIYGSIAGVIITLFYFYICSFVFIWGAEINYYIHNDKGTSQKLI
ncbi:MAG: YihY/virulence factor BrkB family protein [Proteobacteria bacterium]|nr:YihY/virulence factor BrkB family protein [Pseudomonadota bacterium]